MDQQLIDYIRDETVRYRITGEKIVIFFFRKDVVLKKIGLNLLEDLNPYLFEPFEGCQYKVLQRHRSLSLSLNYQADYIWDCQDMKFTKNRYQNIDQYTVFPELKDRQHELS